MTGRRRQIPGSDEVLEKENKLKKKAVCMRKIRIFYNDPDATDSSSDDESSDEMNKYGERVKRVVREVDIPMYNSSEGSRLSTGVRDTTDSILSPVPDHCSGLDSCNNFREPAVKERRDYPFASPLIFDDSVPNIDDEYWLQQLEYRPPLRIPEMGLELGKEELDWLNSL